MNYKFQIYRQANLTASFNKYDLDEYVFVRQITQNGKWGLKIERDREFFTVIRTPFNGSVSVKGSDFDFLITLEGDTKQYALVILQECSGVWSEKWKGYFSYFDFKVDLDRCLLTFEPAIWDIYTPVFDQMDMERNILSASTGQDIMMDAFEWPSESISYNELAISLPVVAAWQQYYVAPLPSPNEYYLYSQESIFLEWVPVGGGGYVPLYSITQVYKREYAFNNSDIVPPTGLGWVVVPDEVSPGVWKWVRPIGNSLYQTYSYVASGRNVYEVLELPPTGTAVLFHGCITLKSVLEYFVQFFDLTYVSDFFNDTPCPMGGLTLELTMLQQISNLRDVSDVATKGMMKLKDLLIWIRDTFNVYWYIDSNGDFRLEHRKYFDQGLSYTAYVSVIELDLNLYPDHVRHLSRYEWSKPSLFRFEKLEIPYSYFPDWVEAGIEYPQGSIIGNETKTTTVIWGTDLVSMNDYSDELPKQGWVLLNVNLVWSGGIGVNKVINTVGAISGVSFQNARFSTANLLRDLWGWGRLLSTGNVNGNLTTFGSIERLRKQVELTIPQCCLQLDYNGLFHTDLGDGLLDSAELDENGNLKMNLIYE